MVCRFDFRIAAIAREYLCFLTVDMLAVGKLVANLMLAKAQTLLMATSSLLTG